MKTFLVKLPDRNILVEPMKIKHLRALWTNHVIMVQTKKTEEEYQEWIDSYLEELYPELNKFEREYAFVQVYGHASNTSEKTYSVYCPECGSDKAKLYTKYKETKLKPFHADIGDYRVFYSLPEDIGDPGYPIEIAELNSEVSEPRKGDIVISGNKSVPWRPGIPKSLITKIIRPIGDKISLEELDPESYTAVMEALQDVHAPERFNEFSTSPVTGVVKCECQCGYSHEAKLSRAIDVLMNTTNAQSIQSIMMTKISYKGLNYADHKDIDEMDMIEFTIFQSTIKKLEDQKK